MDYYIDIQIKPDAEMRENVLLNMTYTKFHKVLSDLAQSSIGVSFPNYRAKLGDIIRIHGSKNHLKKLQKTNWLGGLIGYCSISEILPIPEQIKGYRTISRIRQNMTNAKLQRLIKRSSISENEIKKYKAKMYETGLSNPYLELNSTSNGNKYRRYIQFGEIQEQPISGHFDYFGLSKTATIPWF